MGRSKKEKVEFINDDEEKTTEKSEKPGKLSINKIRSLINKKAGFEVAFDLQEENPTSVIDWIPSGSRWLDSIIAKGQMAGIPVGKISEIAGLEACVTEDTLIEVEIDD